MVLAYAVAGPCGARVVRLNGSRDGAAIGAGYGCRRP